MAVSVAEQRSEYSHPKKSQKYGKLMKKLLRMIGASSPGINFKCIFGMCVFIISSGSRILIFTYYNSLGLIRVRSGFPFNNNNNNRDCEFCVEVSFQAADVYCNNMIFVSIIGL